MRFIAAALAWLDCCGSAMIFGFILGAAMMWRMRMKTHCHYQEWVAGFKKSDAMLARLLKEDRDRYPQR
jgi:hypothetical protein